MPILKKIVCIHYVQSLATGMKIAKFILYSICKVCDKEIGSVPKCQQVEITRGFCTYPNILNFLPC